MAMQLSSRSLFSKALISSLLPRTVSSCPLPPSHHPLSLLRTALRPLSSAVAVAATSNTSVVSTSSTTHFFSTRATSSSLNDPSPNWSNRPPKETILLDGCDFEHWLVVLEKPDESMTRDDIIDSYIKTLAKIVGSEEEARMKIYSVSTKHYFAFGALVSEELSNKIKELPGVRWVLPDSYLDVRNKDYGGEPFINGQAVPYDPKYHEEWVRNNAKANERNRRNDRPRQNDRSRNFERRRENMQSRDGMGGPVGMPPAAMGAPGGLPPGNTGGYVAPPPRGMGGPPPGNMGGYGPPSGPPQGNMGGYGPSSGPPPGNMGGHGAPSVPPTGNMGGYGPPPPNGPGGNMGGYRGPSPPHGGMGGPPGPPPSGMGGQGVPPYGGPQHNNYGPGIPQNNHGGMHQGFGGAPSNPGWSNNVPGNTQNFQNNANGGGGPQDYQNGYSQFK